MGLLAQMDVLTSDDIIRSILGQCGSSKGRLEGSAGIRELKGFWRESTSPEEDGGKKGLKTLPLSQGPRGYDFHAREARKATY